MCFQPPALTVSKIVTESGYSIGFDARRVFSLSDSSGFGKNVKIFAADMSLSECVDNRKKDVLILGKVQRKG